MLILLLSSSAALAQNITPHLKMTSTYGSENVELLDLLRFEGVDLYQIKFSGDDLKGKSYKITVKEFWSGKLKSEKVVIDTKDLVNAGLDKVNDTTLKMKVISKTTGQGKIKISFIFDRFSNTKEYTALKTDWVFRSDGASDFGQTVPLKRSCNYIKKLGLFLSQYSFSKGFTFQVNPV